MNKRLVTTLCRTKKNMAKPTQRKRSTKRARQYGGRVLVFRGSPLQKGHGLGGLFKSLLRVAVPVIRRAAPIVKKVAVRVGKSAVKRTAKAGTKVLKDVATNRTTLKEALKERAQEAALSAAMDAINKSAATKKTRTPVGRAKKKQRRTNAPRL